MGGARSDLTTTLATWVYVLHVAGVAPADDEAAALCAAVQGATDEAAGDAAGEALAARCASLHAQAGGVPELGRALYGDRARDGMGEGDRDARTHRIRRYQFDSGLPWLALVWERRADGGVTPGWVIVQRLTDEVTAMDPNPWDDVDEERHLPVGDFLVLWELSGCASVHLE